ncbi:MAG: ShlB/FhaC/HecB family hemolysin secretion/activation protein, partial [Sphaerospermopsis kisseleviana]
KEFEERELTLEQIRAVSDAVTQLYLNRNYLNSRAVSVTPQPDNTDGILVLRVIEGRLAKIDIRGTQRVNPSYIRSRIQLANTVPLNTVKLEDQLRLLRLDPLFKNIEASLRPTGEEGESLLVVTVQEAESFTSKLLIDNYSPVSVGGERLGLEVGYRNLTGLGDLLTGSYYRTFTGGSQVFNLSYQIPVNGMNGTLGVRVSPSRTKITELPFRDLNIEGEQELYEINYRQPLWRSPREEFALSLGFTHQSVQTFVGGGTFQFDGSRTSVIRFGQEYLNRDPQGVWFGRSQFNLGVGLFNATISQDPVPDGRFFSWTGQLQRSQRLNNNHLLLIQADWQFTLNSLLASQQFVIGGGQSVRGYRQNIRSGDYGVRFAVEDRITIQRNESGLPMIQIAPFLDLGVVWNQSGNPNTSPDQKLLLSTGLGFLWNQALGIDNLSMRLDYA